MILGVVVISLFVSSLVTLRACSSPASVLTIWECLISFCLGSSGTDVSVSSDVLGNSVEIKSSLDSMLSCWVVSLSTTSVTKEYVASSLVTGLAGLTIGISSFSGSPADILDITASVTAVIISSVGSFSLSNSLSSPLPIMCSESFPFCSSCKYSFSSFSLPSCWESFFSCSGFSTSSSSSCSWGSTASPEATIGMISDAAGLSELSSSSIFSVSSSS